MRPTPTNIRKMVSVFSSLLMFVGVGLILFHAYIMIKNQN
jgi:hypothetical protein